MTAVGLANFLRMGRHQKNTAADLLMGSDFVLDNEDHPDVLAALYALRGALTNQMFTRVSIGADKLSLDVGIFNYLIENLQGVPAEFRRNGSYAMLRAMCGVVASDQYRPWPLMTAGRYGGYLRSGPHYVAMLVARGLYGALDDAINTSGWAMVEDLLGGVNFGHHVAEQCRHQCVDFLHNSNRLRTSLGSILRGCKRKKRGESR